MIFEKNYINILTNYIKTILIVGAGPIIIGQACEFDYSGTQACKALREEGYKVILINSNPATIMTDPDTADVVYIEPITPEIVAKIIKKERPDVLLPTMGGQTALNIAIELSKNGTLKKYKVELIGANLKAIKKAEERYTAVKILEVSEDSEKFHEYHRGRLCIVETSMINEIRHTGVTYNIIGENYVVLLSGD